MMAGVLATCSPPGPEEPDTEKTNPPAAQVLAPAFDETRAWADLEKIVAIGPRPAGSQGMVEQIDYLQTQLIAAGFEPKQQSFEAAVPVTTFTPTGSLRFTNLYVDLVGKQGKDSPLIIVGSHMDTKFMEGFVGANDGGSSTAALLELARGFKAKGPRDVSYRFLFLDGEEAVRPFWEGEDNTYGSRHYVFELSKTRDFDRLKAFVLLDLVGDKDLQFTTDLNSTEWLRKMFEKAAKEAGLGKFVGGPAQRMSDDHLPFLAMGIPSIDLIDFRYGPQNSYWHTTDDVLENCSAASLGNAAKVAIAGLMALEKHLTK